MKPPATNKAVYCEDCKKLLNGPHQFKDHRIGKEHVKNVRRKQKGPSACASRRKQPKPPAPATAGEARTQGGQSADQEQKHTTNMQCWGDGGPPSAVAYLHQVPSPREHRGLDIPHRFYQQFTGEAWSYPDAAKYGLNLACRGFPPEHHMDRYGPLAPNF